MKKKKIKNLKTNHVGNEKTHDELIWSRLTQVPHTPATLRNTLNVILPNVVKRFMEIMTSPQAIEADWLGICGHLTEEQVFQYWNATGDYASCYHKIVDLAVEFSENVIKQLPTLIEFDLLNKRELGLYKVLELVIRMQAIRFESLIGFSHRKSLDLGHTFVCYSMALIGSEMINLELSADTNYETKRHINLCVDYWHNVFEKNFDLPFPGIMFYNERRAYEDSMKKTSSFLYALIGLMNASESGCVAIERENIELFSCIKKEACYKKIPLITLNEKKPQIVLFRDNPNMDISLARLATVRINFNDYEIGYPKGYYHDNELTGVDYKIIPGIINFTIDPETGDLCFITSCIAASSIMPKGQYLLLKNYVLKGLKKYLESKEPDIDDLFQYSEFEIEERKRSQKENSQVKHDDFVEVEVGESKEDTWRYIPVVKNEEVGVEDDSDTEDLDSLPKHKRVEVINRISGASASEIHKALSRMFGGPERICGSHSFYRSNRNGMVLPVPAHSRMSKNSIATPPLLANLKKWGYSPMEFAIELGLKTID